MWSLVATSLEGFSVTSHEEWVARALCKGIKKPIRYEGHSSGHVKWSSVAFANRVPDTGSEETPHNSYMLWAFWCHSPCN